MGAADRVTNGMPGAKKVKINEIGPFPVRPDANVSGKVWCSDGFFWQQPAYWYSR